jgi:hypothetical protein
MLYLIYELFSGVGFCNQLFSFETAIFLSNMLKRHLILFIRYPLCHCGKADWNYGNFTSFFNDNYKLFLPYGYTFYYNKDIQNVQHLINSSYHIKFSNKFSRIVIIDNNNNNNNQNNQDITLFCRNREKFYIDYTKYNDYDYVYINDSNASRIFYNFYTKNNDTLLLMNNITKSLTYLNDELTNIYNNILSNLPEKYIAIHFRFGDVKHNTNVINSNIDINNNNILKWLDIHNIDNLPIIIMCDRKDHNILNILKNKYNVKYTDEYVATNNKIKNFLIEKKICINSTIFIGHAGSTVSNTIQYQRFLLNKDYYNYINIKNNKIFIKNNEYQWVSNGFYGAAIASRVFWTHNVSN